MLESIRELIKVRVRRSTSMSNRIDLGIPQQELPSVTFFLVAINSILRNGVDCSLFSDNLEIYILQQETKSWQLHN